jgi:hypothetical protein
MFWNAKVKKSDAKGRGRFENCKSTLALTKLSTMGKCNFNDLLASKGQNHSY